MSGWKGVGILNLECAKHHPVAKLVKEDEFLPIPYALESEPGDRLSWPPSGEPFKARCDSCDEPAGASTALIQQKMDALIEDEFETEDSLTLS